ncbi:FmdB family zinc ribbon protein [Mariniblastus fucicola]|uniref:Zinc ribbon domain protein n=1 Tax=Mariniblastus fucicola TaxID=980251 RepID=A0A5B9PG62_9BACT|nr:zinc ribbon domain-containing protein [Mariniblastus fucicola]QEG23586.1 Zinc ribbon domain protein [Mariniblastus fucicola]
MPTYDYECDACGHTWEMFQRITEDAIKQCPECKKKKARRLFGTGSAVMFKGSGFYETDYRSDSYKKGEKAAKDAKAPKPDSSSGGEKKSGQSGSSSSSSSSGKKS